MRALLDTHTFLWISATDPRVSDHAREVMEDGANDIILSVVSAWEIAIKYSLGRMPELDGQLPETWVSTRVERYGLSTLDVTLVHACRIAHLPQLHRDPFDRLLIAQAITENIPIITNDQRLAEYGVEVIW